MSTHVYRLDITYPPGSDQPGWRPRAWTAAENAKFLSRSHRRRRRRRGELRHRAFRWPKERLFLSSSGAYGRANHLTWLGAQVSVHRSEPVTWWEAP